MDGDGYGDAGSPIEACEEPGGVSSDDSDCDDSDPTIHPGATEVCDADEVDEDCDGLSDDADDSVDPATFGTWYADTDGDGFGDAAVPLESCDPRSGSVGDDTDCDDSRADVFPGATEVDNDGVDQDCDGVDAVSGVEDGEGKGGCGGCSSSGAPAGWLAWGLPLMVALRRRRR